MKHSKGNLQNIQKQPVVSCTIFPFLLSQASYRKIPVLIINSDTGTSPGTEQTCTCDLLTPTQLNLNTQNTVLKKKQTHNSSEMFTQSSPPQNLISLPQLESSHQLPDSLQSQP